MIQFIKAIKPLHEYIQRGENQSYDTLECQQFS